MSMPSHLIRDGFQVWQKISLCRRIPYSWDPRKKRPLTICNLFFNHHLPMEEIARILDEEHAIVIGTLIAHQLIKNRRQTQGVPPARVERRWVKAQRSSA